MPRRKPDGSSRVRIRDPWARRNAPAGQCNGSSARSNKTAIALGYDGPSRVLELSGESPEAAIAERTSPWEVGRCGRLYRPGQMFALVILDTRKKIERKYSTLAMFYYDRPRWSLIIHSVTLSSLVAVMRLVRYR